MLGIRLSDAEETMLTRYARDVGRPKSAIARDWIRERLERESVDEEMRQAAAILTTATTEEELDWLDAATTDLLRTLDEEDGGYDWGAAGPPA